MTKTPLLFSGGVVNEVAAMIHIRLTNIEVISMAKFDEKKSQYRTDNFSDNRDIVKTYMNTYQASIRDKLEFAFGDDITLDELGGMYGNLNDYVEEAILNMPDEDLKQYADKYFDTLYAQGIKGKINENTEHNVSQYEDLQNHFLSAEDPFENEEKTRLAFLLN